MNFSVLRLIYVGGIRAWGPFHEQSYIFVYKIVNKSSSRRTIVLRYKGNQSKFTIVIGLCTTVHETGPWSPVLKTLKILLIYPIYM